MKKIFLQDTGLKKNDKAVVTGSVFHHLANVLRVKTGEFFLVGTKDKEFYGKVVFIDKEKIEILLEKESEREDDLIPDVTLYFSVLKGDKNEVLIQKCSEIGINKFVPVLTKNCIVKADCANMNKIERWKKIAGESAMQSGRNIIPDVCNYLKFEDIDNKALEGLKIFGHIGAESRNFYKLLDEYKYSKKFFVFIGPEGDFTEDEIVILKNNGWNGVNVSPYILKSDTAAIFFTSALFMYFLKYT